MSIMDMAIHTVIKQYLHPLAAALNQPTPQQQHQLQEEQSLE
jgi:hypothetical protein